jgi:FlaA1/EpsC-like NDP-sugar epimerase
MSLIRRILNKADKLRFNHYFRSWIIVVLDAMLSLIASLFTLVIATLLLSNISYNSKFILSWFVGTLFATLVAIYVSKSYRVIIRYASLRELNTLVLFGVCKEIVLLLILLAFSKAGLSFRFYGVMTLADFCVTLTALVVIRIAMVLCYDALMRTVSSKSDLKRILIYGVSEKSVSLVARLNKSTHFLVRGFISDDRQLENHKLQGLPIYTFSDEASALDAFKRADATALLFAYEQEVKKERERLTVYCNSAGHEIFVTPSIDKVGNVQKAVQGIRKINIEDLLGRPEIQISMEEIVANFKGKTILVTGAAGSIGSELCRQLATFGIEQLIMFDNAETPLHNVRLEFEERYPELKFVPIIGDVRLKKRLDYVFRKYRPQIVFHAAAYKHVPLMEENPCEAVLVNVDGSRNVADKCLEYDVEKMVMISTDKAVNPTNIMGCTKRLAEIYVQSLGLAIEQGTIQGKTKFVTTRFGNVLGSNGSVIPHFKEQIAAGGPVTVTHPDIIRYFMSIPEACRLVMKAETISEGNQICVFDMGKPVKISFLAEQMIKMAGFRPGVDIEIKYTGLRPGEKLYEEVLATKENTMPTKHDSIFIAKVRDYDYNEAKEVVDKLRELSRSVDIPNMVKLMKATVPEFKSKNSPYEIFDAPEEKK